MTKTWEHPDNEIIDEARREAARSGRAISDILKDMLKAAKASRDTARRLKIQKTQKFLKFRNRRKRGR